MEWLLTQIQQMDIANILVIAVLFWIFKSHLDKKFEKIDQRFEKVYGEISDHRKEIYSMISEHRKETNSMNSKLISIETILHMQGGCRLNYDHQDSKRVE